LGSRADLAPIIKRRDPDGSLSLRQLELLKACRQPPDALAELLLVSLASRLGWLDDPMQRGIVFPAGRSSGAAVRVHRNRELF
jgi:hypothetical protein